MVDPNIEKLLVLQDRDLRRHDLETQLARIPDEIQSLRKKIEKEESARETARERIRQLEVDRKETDNEISSAEQQIVRYRNQQLEVKKNEEYQALTHEIEVTQKRISELEEKSIGVLLEIDNEKERLASIEADFDDRIGKLKGKIETLQEKEKQLRGELEEARKALEEARSGPPSAFVAAYDRQAKSVTFPIVAPVRERKCQGCHLRVSGEVESGLREKEKITTCDSCGRIVYLER